MPPRPAWCAARGATATSPRTRHDRGPDPESGPLSFATSQAGAILAGMVNATSPAFIGRTQQLAQLLELLQRAESGRPAMALVAGEAGVGKTRLLAELRSEEHTSELQSRRDLV